MRVLIIDTTASAFTADSIGQKALGGIETATVELSRHLVALGHTVTVANQVTEPVEAGGVSWRPRHTVHDLPAEVVIVNNDPRLFDEVPTALRGGARRVVWLHNRLRIEKSVRKGHMRGFLQYRPEVVLLGTVHAGDTSRLYPFRRRTCIPLGVSGEFISGPAVTEPPPPRAIFTSQAYRGLKEMIALWRDRIRPAVPGAEFHVFTGKPELDESEAELAAAGIHLRGRVPKPVLSEELRRSRVMLYPGHRDETFCLAAAEALCLGVPVATRGIGSLKERVRDGIDGVVEPDLGRLGDAVIAILTDDARWRRLNAEALKRRQDSGWDAVARRWDSDILRRT